MKPTDVPYQSYLQILREELVPAMGCTEPIALAYGAAKAREVLGCLPERVEARISGNIIKNVKSVIVPNTGGLRGIEAAVAAGLVAGRPELLLEVISQVTEEEKQRIQACAESGCIQVRSADSDVIFDILLELFAGESRVSLHITGYHTNIVRLEKDGRVLLSSEDAGQEQQGLTDRSVLNTRDIIDFADTSRMEDVRELILRQVACNTAIAEEGLRGGYGASIGKVLLEHFGNDVHVRARAWAAAGSDARMSGCELPVVIVSGSGNQGMAASLPVIVYAREYGKTDEELIRALLVSNLLTIHQKTRIGRLSAYCGVVSAGAAAGAGVAYLLGGRYEEIAHTLVNSLAIVSGIVCDGAKASCAAKISSAVEAGLLGYHMYCSGQEFCGGDGLVTKGVEETLKNIGRLGRDGMRETDREIIRIMTGE